MGSVSVSYPNKQPTLGPMGRFGLVLLARPKRYLTALLLLTACVTYVAVTGTTFNFSTHVLFSSNSELAKDYDDFVSTFGEDDTLIYLVAKLGDPFSRQNLTRIASWTAEIEALPRINTVFSLTQPLGGQLPLLANPQAASEKEIAQLRGFVQRSKMYRGLLLSSDGKTAAFLIQKIPRQPEQSPSRTLIPRLWELVERMRAQKIEAHLTGIPVVEKEYIEHVKTDQKRFLPIMLALCTALLLILFRTWRVVFSVFAVFSSVIWAAALLAVCEIPIGITNNIITILVLVVGTSDAIHLLSRYYEEAQRLPDRDQAIVAALDSVGSACFLTTFTTACGFFSLIVIDNWSIRQLALFTPPALMLTFAVCVTFIPLFLAITTRKETVGAHRESVVHQAPSSIFYVPAWINNRLPYLVLLGTLAVIGLSIVGLTRLTFRSNWLAMLNDDNRLQISNNYFEKQMGGILPVELILTSKSDSDQPFTTAAELNKVARFESRLSDDKQLAPRTTFSAASFILDLNQSSLYLRPKLLKLFGKPSRNDLMKMLDWLPEIQKSERRIPPQPGLVKKLFESTQVLSGDQPYLFSRYLDKGFQSARVTLLFGDSSDEQMHAREARIRQIFKETGLDKDMRLVITGSGIHVSHSIDRLTTDILTSLVFVLLMVSATFVVLFRSLWIGLLSMLPNSIPVLFSMGMMPFFGLHLNFSIAIIFAIGYGIAVDDTIHFLVRYLEHLKQGGISQEQALTGTVVHTGRPMIYTSLLLVLGFGVLFVSEFKTAHTLGTLGIIISIAALLGDLFFLPVLLKITRYAPGLDAPCDSTR